MPEDNKVKIAVIASVGLGDGVILLILANNLARNNFDVFFYSNTISQLSEWLPNITVRPYPNKEIVEEELDEFDIVLADNKSIISNPNYPRSEFKRLREKYIYLSLGFTDPELINDHTQRLKERLSPEKFEQVKYLAKCAGEIRFQHGKRNLNMVENSVIFCKEKLKLNDVTSDTGLVPPQKLNLTKNKFNKRILLHPFSSAEKKNWKLKKFIKFAELIKKDGWEPVFLVAPYEQEKLQIENQHQFEAPLFPTISELAAYIYESHAIVCNNSGTMNLASALDLPSLSITYRGKNHRWRPGWKTGLVITPIIKLKIGEFRIWEQFITVGNIYKNFNKLIKNT